jgi:HlyD family secretion protein
VKTRWILAICLLMTGCAAEEGTEPEPSVTVKTARAELGEVRLSVTAPAAIFPRQQANIAARLTAPILSLHAGKGDRVRSGQLLAELEDRDLMAQKDEASAAVSDAQANLLKVTEGTLPAEIERARGEVVTAEAALNRAQKVYDRRRDLFSQGAIPNRDLLTSETELSQAKSVYEVAKNSLELLQTRSREQDVRIAQSRLDQANARLNFLSAQVEFTKIRSPFDGTIVEQFMYAGDMAKPDSPIFSIMDLSTANARAQVPGDMVAPVRNGQRCVFRPADSPKSGYSGTVSVINRAVDSVRRTIEVWCEIPHPDLSLRAGVFGRTEIVTGMIPESVLVPQSAVQMDEGTHRGIVMVVDDKHVAHKREVKTGEIFEGKVHVVEGLEAGETVIVEGGYGLPDGTEVRNSEAIAQ